jgi:hypothetical protein
VATRLHELCVCALCLVGMIAVCNSPSQGDGRQSSLSGPIVLGVRALGEPCPRVHRLLPGYLPELFRGASAGGSSDAQAATGRRDTQGRRLGAAGGAGIRCKDGTLLRITNRMREQRQPTRCTAKRGESGEGWYVRQHGALSVLLLRLMCCR